MLTEGKNTVLRYINTVNTVQKKSKLYIKQINGVRFTFLYVKFHVSVLCNYHVNNCNYLQFLCDNYFKVNPTG